MKKLASPEIHEFYRNAFAKFGKNGQIPPLQVEFYNYIGLNHTIRMRAGKVFVRIAEIFRDASPEAQTALSFILVGKLLKNRNLEPYQKIYRNFVATSDLRSAANDSRQKRGRKMLSPSKGDVYDLEEMFDHLNADYFQNQIAKPTLSWSQRKTFRRFGHYDSIHQTIVLSKSLDAQTIPKTLVEFVLYHEMLHIKHPTKIIDGKHYSHTAAFRADEKLFHGYQFAFDSLNNLSEKLRKQAKKKRSWWQIM